MEPEAFNQLVANIKRRGGLESLPYCATTERGVEIVSGHHRVRAAKAAGLKQVPLLLDTSGLSRSAIVAKQLAHNNINGFDDKDVLRRLVKHITEVDDLLEAYLPKDLNVEPQPVDLDKLLAPRVTFDWKTVTLAFLPHQFTAFKEFADLLVGTQDLLGVAPLPYWQEFTKAMSQYSRIKGVVSIATVVAILTGVARRELAQGVSAAELAELAETQPGQWVELEGVLGTGKVPVEAAVVIRQAIERLIQTGQVSAKAPWQAVEFWAADSLGGQVSGAGSGG